MAPGASISLRVEIEWSWVSVDCLDIQSLTTTLPASYFGAASLVALPQGLRARGVLVGHQLGLEQPPGCHRLLAGAIRN